MQPHAAERRHLERQIAYARPIFMVLALVELLERPPAAAGRTLYCSSPCICVWRWRWRWCRICNGSGNCRSRFRSIWPRSRCSFCSSFRHRILVRVPVVALSAGIHWGTRSSVVLAGIVTLALLIRTALIGPLAWEQMLSWIALATGTFAAGVGMAFLGSRQRKHATEQEYLAAHYRAAGSGSRHGRVLASDSDRIGKYFRLRGGSPGGSRCGYRSHLCVESSRRRRFAPHPENLPTTRSDGFLLDHPDASVCWNHLSGSGDGFGWNRNDGRRLKDLPRLPGPMREELGWKSVMGVTLDLAGQPVGRLMLGNGRRRFLSQDLQWLERIIRHLGPPLQNLFVLRHIRAHAIEGERSRISREIHDGILQTLLSVDIQLDVLRRKVPVDPEQAVGGLSSLQQTVRNETDELRRMVTDMRPLRVQSADLVDLMRGFGERFRNESGLGLDLLIDAVELQIPDRICRDLFQIYRESLHNVKKHAHASHVVVKLWQNESQVVLVVDDNGEGFSFAGRFTGDELDRLRLGPISIKERTRSVGGVLTVESTPAHGARLTVEVPLG